MSRFNIYEAIRTRSISDIGLGESEWTVGVGHVIDIYHCMPETSHGRDFCVVLFDDGSFLQVYNTEWIKYNRLDT